jgi:hypothetical protein
LLDGRNLKEIGGFKKERELEEVRVMESPERRLEIREKEERRRINYGRDWK